MACTSHGERVKKEFSLAHSVSHFLPRILLSSFSSTRRSTCCNRQWCALFASVTSPGLINRSDVRVMFLLPPRFLSLPCASYESAKFCLFKSRLEITIITVMDYSSIASFQSWNLDPRNFRKRVANTPGSACRCFRREMLFAIF